jgi:hypothetical protein
LFQQHLNTQHAGMRETETTFIDDTRPEGRSRLTNGRCSFLGNRIDNRTIYARRYRDLRRQFMALATVRGPQRATLAETAASLQVALETLRARQVQGEPISALDLVRLSNSLRRCLRDLKLSEEMQTNLALDTLLDPDSYIAGLDDCPTKRKARRRDEEG